jgi:hypothetical protein
MRSMHLKSEIAQLELSDLEGIHSIHQRSYLSFPRSRIIHTLSHLNQLIRLWQVKIHLIASWGSVIVDLVRLTSQCQVSRVFHQFASVGRKTETNCIDQAVVDAVNFLGRDLLALHRISVNVHGEDKPAVLQVFDVILDCIDTAQAELFFELIERNLAGRVAHQIESQFFQRPHFLDAVARGNVAMRSGEGGCPLRRMYIGQS